ncbi:MAG: DEAD/DEAH box helicase [Bdellovibrionales bacterium]
MESFAELNLSPAIQRAIQELGYTTPSPIQQQALPILMGERTDFIGLAATGTGKTAAFGIPLLEQINPSKKFVQGLIMCPTRELAVQVSGQINLLGKYKGIRSIAVYGGSDYANQLHGLKQGAQVVVGTPGRLIDHMNRGTLKLENVQTLILDEADEMISMGFKEDLEAVLKATNADSRNIWLFSATMGKEVRRVADTYLRQAQQVQVNRTEVLSTNVEQTFYGMRESDKPEILCKLIDLADDFYGLIFCQTKLLVTDLTHYLTERGHKVDSLHGDKDQKAREKTMQAFRDKRVRILICTDVASRGLDVKDVTHVINYSIPRELDIYVHRIGRTARGGKGGKAISLVTPTHRSLIGRIEKMTKSKIVECKIPTRRDVGSKKISKVLAQFQSQKFYARAMELLNDEWKAALANMTPEEIVGRFLTLTSPEIFEDREKSKPLLTAPPPPKAEGQRHAGGGRRHGDRRDRGAQREDRGHGRHKQRHHRHMKKRGDQSERQHPEW